MSEYSSIQTYIPSDEKNAGQLIIYGYLFMYMSLGVIASIVHYGFHHDLLVRNFAWMLLGDSICIRCLVAIVFHNRVKSKWSRIFVFYMPASLLVVAAVVLLLLRRLRLSMQHWQCTL